MNSLKITPDYKQKTKKLRRFNKPRSNMPKILFSLFTTLCCLSFTYAQGLPNVKNHSWISYMITSTNHSSCAIGMNSQFMKSGIGLDFALMNSIPAESTKIERKTAPEDSFFVFEGVAYNKYINYISDIYRPTLVTLMDIKNEYLKDFPLRHCLFIINNIPITTDPRAFRIDKDAIVSVKGFAPNEIATLTEGKSMHSTAYVVRIHIKPNKPRRESNVNREELKYNKCHPNGAGIFRYLHHLNRNQEYAFRFFTSSMSFTKDLSLLRFSYSEVERCHASRLSFR